MSGVPHYRFRPAKDTWPLIQFGPGILTVNQTQNYHWGRNEDSFDHLCREAVAALFHSLPESQQLTGPTLQLRYLNRFDIDFESENVLEFYERKLGTTISLPENLFKHENIIRNPHLANLELAFPVQTPKGTVAITFSRANIKVRDLQESGEVLLGDFSFISKKHEIRNPREGFGNWLEGAHGVIDASFFTFIAGDLENKFSRQ